MIAEHIIYSAALAVLAGMVFYHYTGRDLSWIIILCAWAPDIDFFANIVLHITRLRSLIDGIPVYHGAFHNIAVMVLFGIVMACLLHPFGIKIFDSLFFSIVGFGAHLIEDALVYDPGYRFLWPLSSKVLGLALLPNMLSEENYVRDFFAIANTEILVIGLVCLLVAIMIRTWYERSSSWIRWYMPDCIYRKFFQEKRGTIQAQVCRVSRK
jgi:hypothetical protein